MHTTRSLCPGGCSQQQWEDLLRELKATRRELETTQGKLRDRREDVQSARARDREEGPCSRYSPHLASHPQWRFHLFVGKLRHHREDIQSARARDRDAGASGALGNRSGRSAGESVWFRTAPWGTEGTAHGSSRLCDALQAPQRNRRSLGRLPKSRSLREKPACNYSGAGMIVSPFQGFCSAVLAARSLLNVFP